MQRGLTTFLARQPADTLHRLRRATEWEALIEREPERKARLLAQEHALTIALIREALL